MCDRRLQLRRAWFGQEVYPGKNDWKINSKFSGLAKESGWKILGTFQMKKKQDDETEAWRGWVPCPSFCKSGAILKLKGFFFLLLLKRKMVQEKKPKPEDRPECWANYSQTLILNQAIANIDQLDSRTAVSKIPVMPFVSFNSPVLRRNVPRSHPVPVSLTVMLAICFFRFISEERTELEDLHLRNDAWGDFLSGFWFQ